MKPSPKEKSDPAVSYDAFKEHEGQRYTGMKIGRSHKWYYDPGEWKETKVTPDLWQIQYAVNKRRAGRAPEGSGVPVGTEYHWEAQCEAEGREEGRRRSDGATPDDQTLRLTAGAYRSGPTVPCPPQSPHVPDPVQAEQPVRFGRSYQWAGRDKRVPTPAQWEHLPVPVQKGQS